MCRSSMPGPLRCAISWLKRRSRPRRYPAVTTGPSSHPTQPNRLPTHKAVSFRPLRRLKTHIAQCCRLHSPSPSRPHPPPASSPLPAAPAPLPFLFTSGPIHTRRFRPLNRGPITAPQRRLFARPPPRSSSHMDPITPPLRPRSHRGRFRLLHLFNTRGVKTPPSFTYLPSAFAYSHPSHHFRPVHTGRNPPYCTFSTPGVSRVQADMAPSTKS